MVSDTCATPHYIAIDMLHNSSIVFDSSRPISVEFSLFSKYRAGLYSDEEITANLWKICFDARSGLRISWDQTELHQSHPHPREGAEWMW